MKLFRTCLIFVFISAFVQIAAFLTCSTPGYSSGSGFTCAYASNAVAPFYWTDFPGNSKILTMIADLTLTSRTGPSCGLGFPYSLILVTIQEGSNVREILELEHTSAKTFSYKANSVTYHTETLSYDVFSQDSYYYVLKFSIDMTSGSLNMATTFGGLAHIEAPTATITFPTAWSFDSTTRIRLGGRAGSTSRYGMSAQKYSTWNGVLPYPGTYTGALLLGYFAQLIAEYKFREYQGFSLASSGGSGTAYLGTSTSGSSDTVNSPKWMGERAILKFTPTKFITLPAFTIGQASLAVPRSLSLSFWVKATVTPSSSNYIFRYSDTTLANDRFSLQLDSSLYLQVCSGGVCNPAFSGLSLNSWTHLSVNWGLRIADTSNYNGYYSVYKNGDLVVFEVIMGIAVSAATKAADDKVRFGGFTGQLAAIQIYSPGSLQVNKPTWCTAPTCAADLGASSPPTCLIPASCHTSCNGCIDSTDLGCLQCATGRYFYQGKCVTPCPSAASFLYVDYCVASCPLTTYTVGTNCYDCLSNCDVCPDGSSCTTCSSGYYRHNGVCLDSCPQTMYGSGGICYDCPDDCKICVDGTTCSTCNDGYYLHDSGCVSSCPATTFTLGTNCISCPPDCDICSDGATCSVCSPPNFLYGIQCEASCPVKTFPSGTDCLNCIADCDDCFDENTCNTCTNGHYLYNGVCVGSCPETMYGSGTECYNCVNNCKICGDGTTCSTCLDGYYLYDSACVASCPITTFTFGTNCLSCPTDCDICSDGTTCFGCTPPNLLYGSQCQASCPIQTFPLGTECLDCIADCDACSDSSTCDTCSSGYNRYNSDTECVSSCPETTFPFGGACESCINNCKICGDSTTCSTCSDGFFLHGSGCVGSCPIQTFTSGTDCLSCPTDCDTCSDAATCSVCTPPNFLRQNQCVASCPIRTFTSGTNCFDCPSDCDTCSDGVTCSVCTPPKFLYQNQCVASCPIKTFTSGTNCLDCPSRCDVCVDGTTCTTCTTGSYFYMQACYGTCPTAAPYRSPTVDNTLCYQACPSQTPYVFNHICYKSCPPEAPYSSQNICYSEDENPTITETAKLNNAVESTAGAILVARSISSPSTPALLMFSSVSSLLQYTRFLNISRSESLEKVFQSEDDTTDFIPMPTMSEKMQESFENYPIPFVFERYGVSSSFLLNQGDNLLGILTIFGFFVISLILHKGIFYLRNIPMARSIIIKSRFFFQNYFIGQFYGMLGDIVFSAVLELRTVEFTDKYSLLSFLVCIFCVILGGALFTANIWIVKKYQKKKNSHTDEKSQKEALEKFSEEYKGIELLFNDFEDASFTHQALLIFFVGRNIVFCFIVAVLYSAPIWQCLLLLTINLAIVGYYICKKPIKSRMDYAEQLLYEVILLIVSVCFLIMAVADYSENRLSEVISAVSQIIIVLNIACKFAALGFLAFRYGLIAWKHLKMYKSIMKKKKATVTPTTGHMTTTLESHRPLNLTDQPSNDARNFDHIEASMMNEQCITMPQIETRRRYLLRRPRIFPENSFVFDQSSTIFQHEELTRELGFASENAPQGEITEERRIIRAKNRTRLAKL